MKTYIYDVDGKKGKQMEVPEFFKAVVRKDLIQKIVESMKRKQPYSPNPLAGNMYSASGKLKHHRHVWKSQYGRGMSRVPRKQRSRKGSQFDWVGATVPNTRGGRRAHPPKVLSMIGENKINKKELKAAIISALSATASEKWVLKRYETLKNQKIETLPIIIESKITELKIKKVLEILKKILGEKLFSVSIRKREVRSGKGKLRGRKHKINSGLLFVTGNNEKLKTTAFEVLDVNTLSVENLANTEPGRITVYTEKAIKDLGEKYK